MFVHEIDIIISVALNQPPSCLNWNPSMTTYRTDLVIESITTFKTSQVEVDVHRQWVQMDSEVPEGDLVAALGFQTHHLFRVCDWLLRDRACLHKPLAPAGHLPNPGNCLPHGRIHLVWWLQPNVLCWFLAPCRFGWIRQEARHYPSAGRPGRSSDQASQTRIEQLLQGSTEFWFY